MVGSYYQNDYPSACHYCTFWSIRRPNLPSKAIRTPRVPKTSKGILRCQQLLSSINVNGENGSQPSPVHEITSFLDKAKPVFEIVPVHEGVNIQDKPSNGDCFPHIEDQTIEEVICNGKYVENMLTGTEPNGDVAPVALLQNHVYCPSVSLPRHRFSGNILARKVLRARRPLDMYKDFHGGMNERAKYQKCPLIFTNAHFLCHKERIS